MTSTLQTNSSKKHFKEGDNRYLVCNSLLHAQHSVVPQFNIRGSSAADYKRTESHMTYCFSAEKKIQVISSKR